MYDAMISMVYNMGIGNFRTTDFIQLVKRGKYTEAGKKIKNTMISYKGHIYRRAKESKLFSIDDVTKFDFKS
jgi:GH24 family phage-related lysozyme (muramidase)